MPSLQPSTEYSYLRFMGPAKSDDVEVLLPNDASYVVTLDELRQFLKRSEVEDYEKLVDFIYNFGHVLWKRQDQRYYPVNSKKLTPPNAQEIDETLEISYGF